MNKVDLAKVNRVYFVGIGGIGMSAVARMFLMNGKEVFGSDISTSKITNELEKLGAKIEIGTSQTLPKDVDLLIYTVAVPENHPLLSAARNLSVPIISYPESLGLISEGKFTIAVAGTHGKTTTTAMIAKVLIDAGLDPTVIVGSLLKESGSNFIPGKSKYFVVEACEYKRSFLNISPNIAVITNIDDDHLDYYGDLLGIQQGFREFLGRIKKGGILITDEKSEKVFPALKDFQNDIVDYKSLDVEITLNVPGEHNIQNARAAFAVAKILGVPEEKIVASLASFSGTWRRFDYRGKTAEGVLVYDDYAHHPSEIKATLEAAKQKFPDSKILVVFQPHLYSRTREHFNEFAGSFSGISEIAVLPIYAAREPVDENISSKKLVENFKQNGLNTKFFPDFESVIDYAKSNLKNGDILMTMGAGDVNKLAEILTK